MPTFNACVIEMNVHRIKELNEQFVLFNDDMYLNNYVSEDFFFKNNLPRGSAIFKPVSPISNFFYMVFTNTIVLNKHFDFKKCIKKNKLKFFNILYFSKIKDILKNYMLYKYQDELLGFIEYHTASPLLKSTLIEIWNKESEFLNKVSKQKFRQPISVNQWLIKNWQFMKGEFEPISPKYTQLYELTNDNAAIINSIKEKKYKVICINDVGMDYDFEKAKKEIITAFSKKFPQLSKFEKF